MAGLVTPAPAPAAVLKFLCDIVGIEFPKSDCLVSHKARIIPAGYACRGDVCIAASDDRGRFIVGEVMLFFQTYNRPYCLLNVYFYSADTYNRNDGLCDWTTGENYQFIDVSEIWAATTYNTTGRNSIRTLIPWLFRKYDPFEAEA